MPATHVSHPVFARIYGWMSPSMDRAGMREHRQRLLQDLEGRVIEVGAGNGLNFAHYPAEVTEVVAVEPEPTMRRIGQGNAARAGVRIAFRDAVAEDLGLADATFDAGVASLVLCSVTDQHRALCELHRVIRPGGELRFLEHVRAPSDGLRRVQRALDATVWPRVAGGCHTHRDTVSDISAAGFEILECDAFTFPASRVPAPTAPHVLGRARRPA